ncbi:fungal-specific transcription factor domain-containing protein [Coniochaeta sp. 2T2.1]|nr:fungal-specific transcription factor domain-containing protein [Coniochaeta sp. 2T2.1]
MPQPSTPGGDLEGLQAGSGPGKRSRGARAAVACDSCRTRKVKCDGGFPCSSCTQNSFDCSYKDRQPYVIRVPGQPDDRPLLNASESQVQSLPSSLPAATRRELRPASLASQADDAAASELLHRAFEGPADCGSEDTARPEDASAGLGEVNLHTGGSEFYGPSGTFYFLAKLRSHANSGYPPSSHRHVREGSTAAKSVVNLLHSSDYTSPPSAAKSGVGGVPTGDGAAHHVRPGTTASVEGQIQQADMVSAQLEVDIQRECVRLYFENLHCIHPVLDRASFLARCEKHVWCVGRQDGAVPLAGLKREKKRFLALFDIVLAIGAVIAGETSLLAEDRTVTFLQAQGVGHASDSEPPYPPIRVALLYFEKAKALLDDVFESTSFETALTLFLMAVFCQTALKPHSCYMYMGMALRTSLAIGIPTAKRTTSEQERRLWWALYSFEIEMSSSSGRQPFVQSPDYYGIMLPSDTGCTVAPFINCMVAMAKVLGDVAANTNHFEDDSPISEKTERATGLEGRLEDWKAGLPRALDIRAASLTESDMVIKQKTVLKLRYLNFRVLIHRPFLLLNTTNSNSMLSRHVLSCVESARELIQFVYETYLYRPYFRTWWYNCTYVLDATMVLLYVVLTNTSPLPVEVILGDIDKSLEIFAAMRVLAVARRCTEIIKEVLSDAKQTHVDASFRGEGTPHVGALPHQPSSVQFGTLPGLDIGLGPDDGLVGPGVEGLSYEELYTSLVDPNMVYNFLNFEDWNTWPGTGESMGQG